MGSTLQLDGCGDLVIDGSRRRLAMATGTEKIRQDLAVIIKSAIGSLATDPQFGTDILAITGSNGDTSLISAALSAAICQHPQIASVDTISIANARCSMSIDITATLDTGDTITAEVST